jgi:transketolase
MMKSLLSERIRQLILEVSLDTVGPTHLGGSLSSVEILSVLFSRVMNLETKYSFPETEDIFILSKGHCYLALLSTLCEVGRLDRDELRKYQSDEGDFGAHPIVGQTKDIISSNGSLGHGLGFGLGISYQRKLDGESGSVFVLMGDGECSEGSIFEAALLCANLNVDNLVAIIDSNSYGNDGGLAYGDISKVSTAFLAFGWAVIHVDGHNEEEIYDALTNKHDGKPLLVVARTKKGSGLAELEGSNESHHMKLLPAHLGAKE